MKWSLIPQPKEASPRLISKHTLNSAWHSGHRCTLGLSQAPGVIALALRIFLTATCSPVGWPGLPEENVLYARQLEMGKVMLRG